MLSFLHGVPWVHIIPALLAVIFAFLYLKTKLIYLKIVFGLLWLILIPNTAYIFTDIQRITLHWNTINTTTRIILVVQYFILEMIGLVTYIMAMLPFESNISTFHFSNKKQLIAIILFNLLIGFGMVLGRTGYTNSYVIFTHPSKVLSAALNIITSPKLLGLTIAFGIVCNCIYIIFRSKLMHYAEKERLL